MFRYFLGGCLLLISTLSFAEQQTWYFVRHFEKQQNDNPSLTEVGKARAVALAEFFTDKTLNHLYSTNYNRTLETASPVAALKNLETNVYDPRNLAELVSELKTQDHVLVVGHSNTTPELLALMGGGSITIEETEYGTIYVLKSKNSVLCLSSFQIPSK
ncbi:histidine phosphatase family protein [uncultured Paraglaciecola sp.]|uniref:SixA phosphatase family protein n=1 Tax=uncultured Paraglaciecola sp. TaxID=1765024 RepID=UPI0030DBC89A|tara:strand:+ start:26637 stop:27113 length:477 start_codon:yes stop_codon:yes gene_type:complete